MLCHKITSSRHQRNDIFIKKAKYYLIFDTEHTTLNSLYHFIHSRIPFKQTNLKKTVFSQPLFPVMKSLSKSCTKGDLNNK